MVACQYYLLKIGRVIFFILFPQLDCRSQESKDCPLIPPPLSTRPGDRSGAGPRKGSGEHSHANELDSIEWRGGTAVQRGPRLQSQTDVMHVTYPLWAPVSSSVTWRQHLPELLWKWDEARDLGREGQSALGCCWFLMSCWLSCELILSALCRLQSVDVG